MKKAIILIVGIFCLQGGPLSAGKPKAAETITRAYDKKLSSQDKKDIIYVLKTLGLGSVTKILSNKSSMNKAGDRIRPVHPLKFLGFVFSQDELKACAYNVRHSNIPFVWSEFWGGLKESLADEAKIGNITDAQINDFSQTVGLDKDIVAPLLNEQKWLEFYEALLKHIPRNENSNRYNI